MWRGALSLLLVTMLCLASASMAWSAAPVIEYVSLGRGADAESNLSVGWMDYHQRVYVYVSDEDGASDICSVTITDPGGQEYTLTPADSGDNRAWYQTDEYGIMALLWESDQRDPPVPGAYVISATDGTSMVEMETPATPPVSTLFTQPIWPELDSVVDEATPTFVLDTSGIPPAYFYIYLQEEGSGVPIWHEDLGQLSGPIIEIPCGVELDPNRSYLWWMNFDWREDIGTDPRVEFWVEQRTFFRFSVYGDWPAVPPALPGMLAYTQWYNGANSGRGAVMLYNTDPAKRSYLTADMCAYSDWSPDGRKLVYERQLPSPSGLWWHDPLADTPPVPVDGTYGGFECRWAPDGERISYSVEGPWSPYTWFNTDIWVANIADDTAYPLLDSMERQERYASWSSDGRWLAYTSCCDPSGYNVWLLSHDGFEHRPVTPAGVVGWPGYVVCWMGEAVAWSPRANQLAVQFSALSGDGAEWFCGIGTISAEGGDITPVFIRPPGNVCCARARHPVWSPDGRQIAFSSAHHLPPDPDWINGKPENGVELWVADADGSGDPVRLTYDYSSEEFASWWAPNSEPGTDVSVTKGDTTVTFDEVTGTGSTTVCVTNELPGPTPQGFQFLGDYYDISTTAEVSGVITIQIHYDDADVPGGQEEWLSLMHWEGGETGHWVDITVRPIDTVNNIITGECYSLSEFGIAFGPQFVGLLPPINNDGSSIFKLNRTVPVKFQLRNSDGSFMTNAVATLYVATVSAQVVGTYIAPESTSAADTGNTFRYDPDADQYIFNLGTKGLSTGTYSLKVEVNGMVAKVVWISLK